MNYPFLAQIEDPDVRKRARKVLVEMELLSEAPANPIGRATPSSEPDHLPKGTDKRTAVAKLGKPGRERPLFERYLYAFSFAERGETRPDPQHHYALLTTFAERDYRHHTEGLPPEKVAGNLYGQLAEGQSRDGAALQREKEAEIRANYVGVPAAEVAMFENVHIQFVWAARDRGDPRRDRDSGHPISGWPNWSDEQRYQRVQTLRTRRMASTGRRVTQDWVAAELGTSRSAVQRYWEPRERAA